MWRQHRRQQQLFEQVQAIEETASATQVEAAEETASAIQVDATEETTAVFRVDATEETVAAFRLAQANKREAWQSWGEVCHHVS